MTIEVTPQELADFLRKLSQRNVRMEDAGETGYFSNPNKAFEDAIRSTIVRADRSAR